MPSTSNNSKTIVRTITLPGGLDATVIWIAGKPEGSIFADATWQENNPQGSSAFGTAETRAARAVGADDEVEWCWEPAELRHGKPAYA